MEIEFDEAKRRWTLEHRGIDFLDAPLVFADLHYEIEDQRWTMARGAFGSLANCMAEGFWWCGRRVELDAELS